MPGKNSGVDVLAKKYAVVSEAKAALEEVKEFWREKLSAIQVDYAL